MGTDRRLEATVYWGESALDVLTRIALIKAKRLFENKSGGWIFLDAFFCANIFMFFHSQINKYEKCLKELALQMNA